MEKTINLKVKAITTDNLVIKGYCYKDFDSIFVVCCKTYQHHKVKPETIKRFTGKIDKNKVEIYEGDMLIDRLLIDDENDSKGFIEYLFPVVWCEKQMMWCIDTSFEKNDRCLTSLVKFFGEHLEVKDAVFLSQN